MRRFNSISVNGAERPLRVQRPIFEGAGPTHNISVWTIFAVIFLSLLMIGCQSAAEVAPPTAAAAAPTAAPTEMPSPTASTSSSPTPEPTATDAPPPEPSPEPAPTATPTPPENDVSVENGIAAVAVQPVGTVINGRIRALLPGSNDSVWVVSDAAAFRWQDGEVTELPGRFVGVDAANGLVWAAAADAGAMLAWDGSDWISYGAERGWTPPDPTAPTGVYAGQNDANGRFWVATNTDLRVFDGQQWESITPAAMGLENIVADDRWFRFTLLPAANGDLWVGACHVSPPGPIGGQGVRVFQADRWQTLAGPPQEGCVTALQGDPNGAIWINFDGSI